MTITTQPFSQTICRRNKHSMDCGRKHRSDISEIYNQINLTSAVSFRSLMLVISFKKKIKFESTFQSQSHVLKVAASLIWKEIFSYEAVNTSQSLLTGTLTCVLARPRVSSFFFSGFWSIISFKSIVLEGSAFGGAG